MRVCAGRSQGMQIQKGLVQGLLQGKGCFHGFLSFTPLILGRLLHRRQGRLRKGHITSKGLKKPTFSNSRRDKGSGLRDAYHPQSPTPPGRPRCRPRTGRAHTTRHNEEHHTGLQISPESSRCETAAVMAPGAQGLLGNVVRRPTHYLPPRPGEECGHRAGFAALRDAQSPRASPPPTLGRSGPRPAEPHRPGRNRSPAGRDGRNEGSAGGKARSADSALRLPNGTKASGCPEGQTCAVVGHRAWGIQGILTRER